MSAALVARDTLGGGLRYGLLGLPLAFCALPLYVLVPNLYATRFGVPLAALGAVLLATRVFDALLDPWIGRWCDRLLASGSKRLWQCMAVAALALAGSFCALFQPATGSSGALWWLAITLLLTSVAFSVLTVAYQSWGSALGGDALQRSRVVAWREGLG
ncbi:MAG: MFS transporter, partial [Rhodoferax sp.]